MDGWGVYFMWIFFLDFYCDDLFSFFYQCSTYVHFHIVLLEVKVHTYAQWSQVRIALMHITQFLSELVSPFQKIPLKKAHTCRTSLFWML